MITRAQLNKCKTIDDLEALGIGRMVYSVGARGGYLGFKGMDVANYLGVEYDLLPHNYGVHCNYLGGGIRGSIQESGYSKKILPIVQLWLDALAEACRRAYIYEEKASGIEDDEWNSAATKAARDAGIKSAY